MRKNFGVKAWLYPMPVLILGTYGEDGTPNAMNAAWGGISEENEISICVSEDHKTTENFLKTKAFTVSVATANTVVAADYVGIVSGEFTRRRDGLCLLEYLPFDADVAVGDKLYSSGLGSVYPRDLYIGEIVEVTGDPYNHTKVAVVKPAADLSTITKVMILTEYTVYTEEE